MQAASLTALRAPKYVFFISLYWFLDIIFTHLMYWYNLPMNVDALCTISEIRNFLVRCVKKFLNHFSKFFKILKSFWNTLKYLWRFFFSSRMEIEKIVKRIRPYHGIILLGNTIPSPDANPSVRLFLKHCDPDRRYSYFLIISCGNAFLIYFKCVLNMWSINNNFSNLF